MLLIENFVLLFISLFHKFFLALVVIILPIFASILVVALTASILLYFYRKKIKYTKFLQLKSFFLLTPVLYRCFKSKVPEESKSSNYITDIEVDETPTINSNSERFESISDVPTKESINIERKLPTTSNYIEDSDFDQPYYYIDLDSINQSNISLYV